MLHRTNVGKSQTTNTKISKSIKIIYQYRAHVTGGYEVAVVFYLFVFNKLEKGSAEK
jgi:hypothetical protein